MFEVGDEVHFMWLGTRERAVITTVFFAAGISPKTGRGRGPQDRLGVWFFKKPHYRRPGWVYTVSVNRPGINDKGVL